METDFAIDSLAKNGLDSLELDELKRLAKDVDGHPLALKLLIILVKKFGISDTLKDLTRYKDLKESTIKKTRRLFDKLAGNEKELLERISVYRQAETMNAIKIMFTDKTPIDAVDNLIDESLLETDHKGSYWLHPLVQEFPYDDLEDKKGAHKLAGEYYMSLDRPKKLTKKENVSYLIEAHYHACMAEEYGKAVHIIFENNLHNCLNLWGNYTLLVDLYSKLLPEDHFGNDVLLKDKEKHGVIIGHMGIAYNHLGKQRKAIEYQEQALKIAQEIGNRDGECVILGNMGLIYSYLGEQRKAIEYFEKALKIAQEIEDPRIIDFCEINLEELKNSKR